MVCGLVAQLTPEIARSWLDVFEKYGLALVCFVVLCVLVVVGLIKVSSYLSTRIFEPLADRHIKFLDRTERCLETQTDSVARIEAAISSVARRQEEHFEICRSGSHHKINIHPKPA